MTSCTPAFSAFLCIQSSPLPQTNNAGYGYCGQQYDDNIWFTDDNDDNIWFIDDNDDNIWLTDFCHLHILSNLFISLIAVLLADSAEWVKTALRENFIEVVF